MKYFDWDQKKNNTLKAVRHIGFEDIVQALDEDRELDRIQHPNQKRYPNQKYSIVEIDNYAYIVPFVEDEDKIFLKTIIPSRKMTKKYKLKESKK